jgi:hypothetical protein
MARTGSDRPLRIHYGGINIGNRYTGPATNSSGRWRDSGRWTRNGEGK